MENNPKPKLLLVDDDEEIRTQMRWALSGEYEPILAGDRPGALAAFRTHRPAVVLLDLGLPPQPAAPTEGLATLGHNAANKTEIPLIDGFMSFIHTQNPGAAMGMFNNYEYRLLVFYVFTVVAVGVLLNMYRQLADNDRFQSATIALILSGAIGNFIDRLHKSTVTDFVRWYTDNPKWVEWLHSKGLPAEYPTWNIADAAIVMGVVMYLLHYLFFERDKETGENAGTNPLEEDAEAPKTT